MALPRIDAPRYEMKIPSTQEKVVYRPYLVKEEKILMIAMESQDEKHMVRAIKDVISACTEGAVNVDSLAMFDLEYVFTQLRSKSAGETTKVSLKCEHCETPNDVIVDLSEIKVVGIDKNKHKIKLNDDFVLMMKYPTVNQLVNAESSKKSDVDKMFDLLAEVIDSLHTADEVFDMKEQSKDEVKDFIESLNSEQFGKIRQFIEESPTAQISASFDCTNCKEHNDIEVQGLGNFFA